MWQFQNWWRRDRLSKKMMKSFSYHSKNDHMWMTLNTITNWLALYFRNTALKTHVSKLMEQRRPLWNLVLGPWYFITVWQGLRVLGASLSLRWSLSNMRHLTWVTSVSPVILSAVIPCLRGYRCFGSLRIHTDFAYLHLIFLAEPPRIIYFSSLFYLPDSVYI